MKKLLLVLVAVLVVAVGLFFFYFDSILKSGIETAGSSALKTEVQVASVGISPLSGSGGIRNLSIGNPEGFNEPYAMQLGGLDVSLEVGSVFSDVVVINSIVIEEPVITYESRLTTDNIRTLISNLGGDSGAQAGTDPAAGPGKRVIIRDFQMHGPQVRVVSALGSAEITIPDLSLQNIGEDSSAVTVAEASRQILAALNRQLIQADIPNLEMLREKVDEEVEQLRERADGLQQNIRDQAEELRDRARGLL